MNELKNYTEFTEAREQNEWLLVYFSASWCKPCHAFSPIVEQTSHSFGKTLNTIKIDVERVPEAAGEFDLKSVPTLLLFNGGNLVESAVGAQSLAQVTHWLSRKVLVH